MSISRWRKHPTADGGRTNPYGSFELDMEKRLPLDEPAVLDTRAIQHYLGHKNIQHTVRYTELSADRFKDFWDD